MALFFILLLCNYFTLLNSHIISAIIKSRSLLNILLTIDISLFTYKTFNDMFNDEIKKIFNDDLSINYKKYNELFNGFDHFIKKINNHFSKDVISNSYLTSDELRNEIILYIKDKIYIQGLKKARKLNIDENNYKIVFNKYINFKNILNYKNSESYFTLIKTYIKNIPLLFYLIILISILLILIKIVCKCFCY